MVCHVKSMGASTAGVLSFKSISYSQDSTLVKIFWLLWDILTYNTGLLAFHRLLLLEYGVVLKGPRFLFLVVEPYARSPRIRLASRMSFGMMVTRLAWMAHRLASSNSLTRYASAASWRHSIAADWNHRSTLKSWAISLTNL